MTLQIEEIYKVQREIWDRFYAFLNDEGLGWPAWNRFLAENGMEKESCHKNFQLQRGGRVSILDPSGFGRLWMSEDFALKALLFRGATWTGNQSKS